MNNTRLLLETAERARRGELRRAVLVPQEGAPALPFEGRRPPKPRLSLLFASGEAFLGLKSDRLTPDLPFRLLGRGGSPWAWKRRAEREGLLGPKRKAQGQMESLLRGAEVLAKALPEATFLEEVVVRLEELARLFATPRDRSFVCEGRYLLFRRVAEEALVDLEAPPFSPFSPLLALFPEGGRYEGPLPGFPGAVLRAEADFYPWGGFRTAFAFFPESLRVGRAVLKPRKARRVYFLRNDYRRQLCELFPALREVSPLLEAGDLEGAERIAFLHALEAV